MSRPSKYSGIVVNLLIAVAISLVVNFSYVLLLVVEKSDDRHPPFSRELRTDREIVRVEGDVTERLRRWLPTGQVGHLQIAAVPDRGEPDDGELAWPWVFDELRRLNWSGWIGCEYRPRTTTSAGLDWLRRLRAAGHAF